ncbi:FeoA family protein [Proteinivorax tanatarense]|uniref:FeoA family protein n=1 Tax=Proteinivorax tanatarense TaxID=1260629 RepID=A0AAU7VJ48_9FIRM
MRLTQLKPGQKAFIKRVNDKKSRGQITRFGLTFGAEIHCIKNIKKGPVIINVDNIFLAIGYRLAHEIVVGRQKNEKANYSFSWKS